VELLIVLTLLAGMSLAVARLMTALLQLDAASAANAARDLTLERLEQRFRSDVHAALGAEVSSAGPGLMQLTLRMTGGEEASFIAEPSGLRWLRRRGDQTQASDEFVGLDGTIAFVSRPPLVELTLQPSPGARHNPSPVRVTALLGGRLMSGEGRP
jgi:hypothetical protein